MKSKPSNTEFFNQIVDLLQSARNKVVQTVNQTMVTTYFEIGRKIVEEEQNGKDRAEYGKRLLIDLSNVLTKEFGKGFSTTNLKQMRQFYLIYSIGQTLSDDFKSMSQKPNTDPEKAIQQTASADFKSKSQTLSADSENAISETPSRNFKLSWSHYSKQCS